MELDLDTFLATVYCVVDELYEAQFAPRKPVRPGPRPELADSEVLTLMVLAQWQPDRSETAFVAWARDHWRAYFPRLLSQSAFNRRARDLTPVLCALGPAVHARLVQELRARGAPPDATGADQATAAADLADLADLVEVFDGVPVPLLRRCRGDRHRLFAEEADVGRGGSDKDWFYGVRLLGSVARLGTVTGFVIGPAATGERWLAEALLRWRRWPTAPAPRAAELAPLLGPTHLAGGERRGPTGPLRARHGAGRPAPGPYLGDLGFCGAAWQAHWRADYGATVLTPASAATQVIPEQVGQATRWLAGLRQIVETAFGWLTAHFHLAFPRAHTYQGLLARLGAKVAAFNLGVYVNHRAGRDPFAFFNPLTAPTH
jgi:hypothetical protein